MDFHYLVTQPDLNAHGTLHGGILTKLIDESCGIYARIQTGRVCVTRHIGSIDFLSKAKLGDILKINTFISRTGSSSIIFQGSVLNAISGKRIAYFEKFVFVAIDESGAPVKIGD